LRWWLEPYEFELQARGGIAQDPRRSAASSKGWPESRYHHQCLGYYALRGASLRQPLCGRADCGNPALPPPKGCEQCLGEPVRGLQKGDLKILADDAMWNSNGHISGSIAQEFKTAGVTLSRAQKMRTPVTTGLQKLCNRMQATRRDETQPWLLWSPACEGWEATVPSISRHPRDPETIADGAIDHALDAVRYGVTWYSAAAGNGHVTGFRIY
jgi:hypothetical protein